MKKAVGAGVAVGASLLVVGAAIQVSHWGRPLPLRFSLHATFDRDRDGAADRWEYGAGEGERAILDDEDGDGRVDRLRFFQGGTMRWEAVRPAPTVWGVGATVPTAVRGSVRHLAICLDGVPFEIMDALWREGHFREFLPPERVIGPFPADSDVALSALMHAPPSPGYENRYFDRRENRIRGGIRVTFAQQLPYHRRLDYAFPGFLRGPAYLFPEKAFFDDLARLLTRFRASSQRVFIAHLSTTDVLFHVRSPEQVRRFVLALERALRELLLEYRGALTITLFSDHGNTLSVVRRVALEEALRAAGYRVEERVRDGRSVVIPGYGLIGAVALYVRPERVEDVCRIAQEVPGVDFCAFRQRGGPIVIVQGRRGRAQLLFDPTRRAFRYDVVWGDPLQLLPLWETLRRSGKAYPDGFISGAVLLEATVEHVYPDAVRRLYEAVAGQQVENPADLLLSLQDGYYFGSRWFERLVRLRSTHGGLTRRSSVGFVMSTDVRFARPLSVGEVLPASGIVLERP